MALSQYCYSSISHRYLAKLLAPTQYIIRRSQTRKNLSYEAIPRTPTIPLVGSMPYIIKAGGPKLFHLYADDQHKRLGPLFIDKIFGKDIVFVSDINANMEIYRTEGQHPQHFVPDSWVLYLKKNNRERGLFFMDGPEWHKTRKIFNRILLKTDAMDAHLEGISQVSREMMSLWKKNPPEKKLQYHLYNWALECLGKVALGDRLRFVEKLSSNVGGPMSREEDFVKSIYDVLVQSNALTVFPVTVAEKLKTKSWKRFDISVTKCLDYGQSYIDEAIENCKTDLNEDRRNSLLYRLMSTENMDRDMVSKLLIDLFFAATDTTSHSASFSLYLLGRNPEKAKIARAEVEQVFQKEGKLSLKAVNEMPYIKGIIKEALRLYPIAQFLNRITTRNISLLGYEIPTGTTVATSIYTMGRDPNHFSDPDSFIPERWIRKKASTPTTNNQESVTQHNQKAYLPWGLGARSCVGKRVAEAELSILLAEALLAFEWTVNKDTEMILQLISVPADDIILQLKSR